MFMLGRLRLAMMNEVPRMKGKQMVKTTFKALTVKHKPRI